MGKQDKKKKRQSTKITKKTKRKRRKLRYGRILLVLFIFVLLIYLFFHFFHFNIQSILIRGNHYLTEQEVIHLSGLEDYPSSITNASLSIKKRLEDSELIKSAKVRKNGLLHITIEIEENKPLFYNKTSNKTVLQDKTEITKKYDVPILINYVPDKIYQEFIDKMGKVKSEILARISEIEYKPNEVDKNRFLLSMQDGNYVYLTIYKFENINNYVEIVRKFEHKKGILYLDSGEYFKVYEE